MDRRAALDPARRRRACASRRATSSSTAPTVSATWPYYESIDLIDAFHPQTILAWALNGRLLPIPNGAPLRLRVERQLGYKHAKYLERIEAVATASPASIGGRGGYWEDGGDYEWYAGI